METKKVDIFGSFLTGVPTPPPAPPPGTPAAEAGDPTSLPPGSDLEKALLATLARSATPINLKVLLAQTMGSPTQVLQILKDMQKVGLVVESDDGAGKSYQATPFGKDLFEAQ